MRSRVDGGTFQLEIDDSDETLGRTWRLRDRHQVRDLRKRFERALHGTTQPVSSLDYFEQSPGFLALVTIEQGEG